MLNVLWLLFILIEFFVTAFTCYYLKQEYARALEDYYKNQLKTRKYFITKRNESKKSIVQINTTDSIDAQKINDQLEYVQLEFAKQGNYIVTEKISKSKIRIGRDSRNDIIVKDRTVSKQQCLIVKKSDIFILKNISDSNVTRLNGHVVKNKKEIKYGDTVEIGKISFKFNSISEAI